MDFNEEQREVIYSTEPKIICLASAASGKTRVLTERVRVLLEEKHIAPSQIVAITYTNLAAEEMRRRLGDCANGMFIGTLHSYAGKICTQNNINIQKYLDREEFDKIIARAILIPKEKFPKIKYLLIDECQDFNEQNYDFCRKCPAENVFYVGDDRQMIYSFRGASIEALREVYDDPTFKKYYLNKNYRNTPEIVNFAENFIWKKDKPISDKSNPMNESGEDVIECSFYEAAQELINSQNWGNWAVLCRTNAQVDTVMEYLESKEVPCISFKKGDVSYDELNELMASDRVKVLTIHSDKGGEHDNVIVMGGKEFNEEERRISYVAATRAKFVLYWCPAIKGTPRKTYKKQTAAKKTFNKVIEF